MLFSFRIKCRILSKMAPDEKQIDWLLSTRGDAEELMASPVGLSLLSQLTRMMPPSDIVDMVEPFSGILKDLHDKAEWYVDKYRLFDCR
jgi:hypothetical protein